MNTITFHGQVRLTDFYYPSKVVFPRTHKQNKQINRLSEISDSKNVLILGTAGQGKSTFLRYLCLQELELGERIPVFVELREIDESTNLQTLLIQNLSFLGVRGMTDEIFSFFLDSGKFTFFLDGFDEVKREVSHTTQANIKTLFSTYPNSRWVVSSRPGNLGDHLAAVPDILVVKVAPLAPEDCEPFLEKLGVEDKARGRLLQSIKSSSAAIQNVLTTPLMLTLLNSTFGTCTVIPKTLHEFYENMFQVLVSKHDSTKPYYERQKATALTNADLQAAFSAFCFLSKDHSVSLTDEQFATCAKGAAKLTGLTFTSEGLRTDLTDSVCLMVRDGIKTAFLHKSIQEFFAAYFLKSLGEPEKVSKLYEKIRIELWQSWQHELEFLEQIDRYRFIEYYRLPSIKEFLANIGYDQNSRYKVKRACFDLFMKNLEVYRFTTREKGWGHLLLLITDNKSSRCINKEFLKFTDKEWRFVALDSRSMDQLFNQDLPPQERDLLRVRLDRHIRATPGMATHYFKKLNEFADRIFKEQTRLSDSLNERNQSFSELLGI